jgi:hypothetical protein
MSGRHESAQDELIAELQAAIDGLRKHFSGQTLLIDGKEMTAEEIIATLQHQIDLIQKTQAAYAEWQKAAAHKRELLANLDDDALEALRELVRMQFGEDSNEFRQLVTTPRRRPRRSAEARARAAGPKRTGRSRHTRRGAPVDPNPEASEADLDAEAKVEAADDDDAN